MFSDKFISTYFDNHKINKTMNYRIYDKEQDDFTRDVDGESMVFKNDTEVYDFLKNDCSYTEDFIRSNFILMKGYKVLRRENEIELEEYDPHQASKVVCDICTYEWVAVRPEGLDRLECPNCTNMATFENT